MIKNSDVVILLTEIQKQGINVDAELKEALMSKSIHVKALACINKYRPMDILNFYEKLRKSYNAGHSKLYINIMKADENALDDPKKVLTTLAALLNQIFQYDAVDKTLFLKHARVTEITKVLELYGRTFDLTYANKLLKLIKADIVVLEYSVNRRDLPKI